MRIIYQAKNIDGRLPDPGDPAEMDAVELGGLQECCLATLRHGLGCTRSPHKDGRHIAGGTLRRIFAIWEE